MISLRKLLIYFTLLIFIIPAERIFSQAAKGQSMRMHAIPIKKKTTTSAEANTRPLIGFVNLQPYDEAVPEVKSAYDWLTASGEFTTEYLTIPDLEKQSKKVGRFSAIWIHRPDSTVLSGKETGSKLVQLLKSYVEKGGKLLLTQQAAHYLNTLGFETTPLQDSTKSCSDGGYGRRLGFHAFRGHPLFSGLNGGAYICRPTSDITTRITGFFGDQIPQQGSVIAVDWDYIFLREDTKIVFEYTAGKGKVVAAGAYMNFSIQNTNGAQLSLFTGNCFRYLLGQGEGQAENYWKYTPAVVRECPPLPESDRLLVAVPPSDHWEVKSTENDLTRRFAGDDFWDIAGERILTMGTEQGGIEEVWAHPFMAFRDYEAGIRFNYKDTIFWLKDERPEVTVNPAFFSRQYKFARAYLKEIIVCDPQEINGVVHYEYRGVYPAELIIRFKSNLRWMWPYSEKVTGSICHGWDADLGAITIQDQSGDLNVMIGGTRIPAEHLAGQFDGFSSAGKDSSFKGVPTGKTEVAGLLRYNLEMNDNLDIVYSASSEGFEHTYARFNTLIHEPVQVYRNALAHADDILTQRLMVTSPDADFNKGYRWALVGTDRFYVNTPGMGKALVAGYSTTRHGWDGGHKVNGRPGYGWYFGRDAEWSGFALLDCGDFAKVKAQLDFFGKYQDLNGKILHEASTSGFIHYDAADATPLYIVLAGKYFRHTNDTAFLRKIWPSVKHAINFCYSTDTDNDHLIENTNVGHGWVEGGELYGSHSTIYMAGSWGAALAEAVNMATFMQDIESESYQLESDAQQRSINEDFWNYSRQFYSYGKNRDGSFRPDETILPAVPIYFRMTDTEKARITLKSIAGNNFTTNWGVRILREDSPWFKPTGYHYGSVWPLFTGWASLAEYATGNPVQGYSHLMNNLNVYKNWGLGFVEEVLNGAEYRPSGVCAHQCWSETMVLQPAIEGLLGLEVRAQARKIILSPQLPPQWDSLTVRNIRMADQLVDFSFMRREATSEFIFTLDQGRPVAIDFMPSFPAGTRFLEVTLNGKDVQFTSFKSGRSMVMVVSFELGSGSVLNVKTAGGISVLPVVGDPKPGDAADGMRIVSANLSGHQYMVEVEGKAGSSGVLEFRADGQEHLSADNAQFLGKSGNVSRFTVDFASSASKYVTKTVTVIIR